MYIRRRLRFRLIWQFSWRNLLCFSVWSSAVTVTEKWLKSRGMSLGLPYAPLGTIGVAVAFYVGFKNAQSYDRFWEGRKVWGEIVNASRTFTNQLLSYLNSSPSLSGAELHAVQQRLVYRHLAWVNALRLQLRRTTIFDRDNLSFVPDLHLTPACQGTDLLRELLPGDEAALVLARANAASQILRRQGEELRGLCEKQALSEYRQVAMMQTLGDLYALQGRCERIKGTPFPRQYAYFSAVFVWIFVALLPFGLVHELGRAATWSLWLAIPLSVLIAWVFTTIEQVGDSSEDPFENYLHDVPMSALCRNIEIDLRQSLGEQTTLQPLQPVADVML